MSVTVNDLRRVMILKGMDERVLNALTSVLTRKNWQDGDRIIQQGASADAVYFLLAGHVRVERRLMGGGTVGLVTLGPGGCFGLTAAIDGASAPSDCLAWGPVRCAVFALNDFRSMMTGDSPTAIQFQLSVMRTLLNDMRDTTRRVAELATLPPLNIEEAGDILTVLS